MAILKLTTNVETKTASMSTPNPIRMDIKVATLNLCLGLQAKKNIVKETIINEKIDILSMQETEINPKLNHNLLSFPGYAVEIESNSKCARVAFYISTRVNYIRRRELEAIYQARNCWLTV